MNKNPLERDIEKKVVAYARSLGMLVYKFTSPACRSVPDRIFFAPSGFVFLIEFKRRGEKPSKAQEIEIKKLRQIGARVYVVDNVEEGKKVLDGFTGYVHLPVNRWFPKDAKINLDDY